MPSLTPAQLLGDIEDLVRSTPVAETIRHRLPENVAWFGRAQALVRRWNSAKAIQFEHYVQAIHGPGGREASHAITGVMVMLQEARHDLRLASVGPLTLVFGGGNVFDYYDEVRKIVALAKSDVLFVDPYLEADFVSRYLPHVSQGVSVRLLAQKYLTALVPAAKLFAQQHGLSIEVRSCASFHDRFLFIDRAECYLSGASFKDGARSAPATLTQIVDAFGPLHSIYEDMWHTATPAV